VVLRLQSVDRKVGEVQVLMQVFRLATLLLAAMELIFLVQEVAGA
jgi:hypothetical protein